MKKGEGKHKTHGESEEFYAKFRSCIHALMLIIIPFSSILKLQISVVYFQIKKAVGSVSLVILDILQIFGC